MGIEDSIGKINQPAAEKTSGQAEKLKGEKKALWEITRGILLKLGIDLAGAGGADKEEEITRRIKEIRQMKAGKEYRNAEDNFFIETGIRYKGKHADFKMVAQMDPNYDPNRKIDYAEKEPDFQKGAERLLKREAIIGDKLPRFSAGLKISADTIETAAITPGETMHLVKTVEESKKEMENFGYNEGRALAKTLHALQYEVRSTALVNEIMAEQNYAGQYELENEFSEDIFNDFDGYMDNARNILNDRVGDKEITRKEAKRLEKEMEKYRRLIKERQLGEEEYCLVHNETYLDKMVVDRDGRVLLSDWKNVGTTQNRELALINDLGFAFESAREHLSEEQAKEFIRGAAEELENFYVNRADNEADKAKGKEIAEAVIRLTRLRSFGEM